MAPMTRTIRRVVRLAILAAALYFALPQAAAAAPQLTETAAPASALPEAGEATVVMLAAPLPAATPLPAPLVWSVMLLAVLLFYFVTRVVVERQRRDLELLRLL